MSCEQLIPGFISLNLIKASGLLCQAFPALKGFSVNCGANEFTDELDRRALCELLCCCAKAEKQKCVKNVLYQVDAFHGYKGYYKAETPFRGGAPVMSRREPDRPTKSIPKGSRIPDVVVVKNPNLPPTLGNIQKVYEMKFEPDKYSNVVGPDGMTQYEAYDDLFKDKIDPNPLTEESCNCGEREKESVLAKASAFQQKREEAMSMVPQINADAPKLALLIVGGPVLATLRIWLAGAGAVVGGILGLAY